MPKSDKELAVQLLGDILNGYASAGKHITPQELEQMLSDCYKAVKGMDAG